MLTVETIGRIRREHFLKGKTIREIARDLKASRNTVRKVLRSGETSFEYERSVQPRPKLGRNRRFLQMCSHYLVEPIACTLASGLGEGASREPGRAGARALLHAPAAVQAPC